MPWAGHWRTSDSVFPASVLVSVTEELQLTDGIDQRNGGGLTLPRARECKGCLGTLCKGCHGTEQTSRENGPRDFWKSILKHERLVHPSARLEREFRCQSRNGKGAAIGPARINEVPHIHVTTADLSDVRVLSDYGRVSQLKRIQSTPKRESTVAPFSLIEMSTARSVKDLA
jgi:hypothetical protein